LNALARMPSDTQLIALDNPIWRALSTTHAAFAEGDDFARGYPPAVTPLAAIRDPSVASLKALGRLLRPRGRMAGLFLDAPLELASDWALVRQIPLNQMIWTGERSESKTVYSADRQEDGIELLNLSHAREMLSLAEMTQPGPFGMRTPELGTYFGIRRAGQLVAMAGERLRFPGYTEVSAVCTKPHHQGHGYAGALVKAVVRHIIARGEIPFLHVAGENLHAIRLYERLGFRTRRSLDLLVVRNDGGGDA